MNYYLERGFNLATLAIMVSSQPRKFALICLCPSATTLTPYTRIGLDSWVTGTGRMI
ncbi:hypothetical protein ACNKHK_08405 [Shigella flexneri]